MMGDARRFAAALGEKGRDLGVQLARHGGRHRCERALVDQVVRERAVAQHLCGFEFGPGVGEVERAHAEHTRRELDAEVGCRHRGAARKLHRRLRQAADAPLDQRGDVG